MSEERTQFRVVQNGNPFEDAQRCLGGPVEFVVDGGANIGDVAWHLLANYPLAEVHAFEPDAESCRLLRTRYCDEPRVKVVELGLSDRSETRQLHRYSESGLNSLLPLSSKTEDYLEGYGTEPLGSEAVALTTLDDYSRSAGLPRIDLLKLDLQGWEIACLDGSRSLFERGLVGAVYVEVNFVELYEGQIYFSDVSTWLAQYGFRWENHYALSFNRAGDLCWADSLFLRED